MHKFKYTVIDGTSETETPLFEYEGFVRLTHKTLPHASHIIAVGVEGESDMWAIGSCLKTAVAELKRYYRDLETKIDSFKVSTVQPTLGV